jgi:formiminoglutamase
MPIVDPFWPRADAWLASEAAQPDLVVVGVPSSKASLTPSRADLTPGEVRQRMHRFSTFHGETGVDLGDVAVRDMGNWPVSELDMHDMPVMVESLARDLPSGSLTIFIGGDNAITRPLTASLHKDLSSVGLITFDAHHDVRSLENGPTNGTPVRGLLEEDGLPGGNVAQIGIHSFANSAAYRRYCEKQGIRIFTVSDVETGGMPSVVGSALAALDHCDRIFVDVDVDVLDRAFAPACPGARPGGLNLRQLSEGVRLLSTSPRVVAMDFVEVDPTTDIANITLDTVAHLILTAAAGLAGRPRATD